MICEGETVMVVLYTSFLRLLEQVQDQRWHDRPDTLYHFMSQPHLDSINSYATRANCSVARLEEVLQILAVAETYGRVSWRIGPYGGELETERFRNLLEKAREMGARIPICDRAAAERICMWQARIRMFLSHSVLLGHRLP